MTRVAAIERTAPHLVCQKTHICLPQPETMAAGVAINYGERTYQRDAKERKVQNSCN